MITCPNCKASLPDWAKNCQFCQADTAQVLRPKQQTPNARSFEIPAWVWACYYAISAWMLLDPVLAAVKIITGAKDGLGIFDIAILIFLGVEVLVAIGLLCRVQIVRNIVNFFCFLGIISALFGLATGLFGTLLLGVWGILWVIYEIFRLCMYGFMIYLIGETDKAVY